MEAVVAHPAGQLSAVMVGTHEGSLVPTEGLEPIAAHGVAGGGAVKIFKGSTGPGQCYNCNITDSPLWRSGWNLGDGFANLCNKCGLSRRAGTFCKRFHNNEEGWQPCWQCKKGVHVGCIAAADSYTFTDESKVLCLLCWKGPVNKAPKSKKMEEATYGMMVNSPAAGGVAGSLAVHPAPVPAPVPAVDGGIGEPRGGGMGGGGQVAHYQYPEAVTPAQGGAAPLARMVPTIHPKQECVVYSVLFEKILTASDTSGYGRIVFPKGHAEQYFPKLEEAGGLHVDVMDGFGNATTLLYRFWVNNRSARMYLMERVLEFLTKSYVVGEGDVLVVGRAADKGTIVLSVRKGAGAGDRKDRKSKKGVKEEERKRHMQAQASHRLLALPAASGQEETAKHHSTFVPLFEKLLTASDTSGCGRIVVPKAQAEAHLPAIDSPAGVRVNVMDGFGNKDALQFRYWMNARSTRVYLLQGAKAFLELGYPSVEDGDHLEVGKSEVEGVLYIVLSVRKGSGPKEKRKKKGEAEGEPRMGALGGGGGGVGGGHEALGMVAHHGHPMAVMEPQHPGMMVSLVEHEGQVHGHGGHEHHAHVHAHGHPHPHGHGHVLGGAGAGGQGDGGLGGGGGVLVGGGGLEEGGHVLVGEKRSGEGAGDGEGQGGIDHEGRMVRQR